MQKVLLKYRYMHHLNLIASPELVCQADSLCLQEFEDHKRERLLNGLRAQKARWQPCAVTLKTASLLCGICFNSTTAAAGCWAVVDPMSGSAADCAKTACLHISIIPPVCCIAAMHCDCWSGMIVMCVKLQMNTFCILRNHDNTKVAKIIEKKGVRELEALEAIRCRQARQRHFSLILCILPCRVYARCRVA